MNCLNCTRGLHSQCYGCECAHAVQSGQEVERKKAVGRPVKDNKELKDPFSTGRKRAAQLYPLDYSKPCEWLGLEEVGGGKHPIKGCTNGKQKHRHHGPVKDTTDNSKGNVHRICATCHNKWHAANDKDYEWEAPVGKSD